MRHKQPTVATTTYRKVQPTMKDLKLTPRGELVRDLGLGILGVPAVYAFILAMIAGLDAAASL